MIQKTNFIQEPYRIFFPLGVISVLWGALIWIPLIWSAEIYPTFFHRYLMINGFSGLFIAGFLMTAVPKFSQTSRASIKEILVFLTSTIIGGVFAYLEIQKISFIFSAICALSLLIFLIRRILKKKINPPYTFIFIFIGLSLWLFSSLANFMLPSDFYKTLHIEAGILSIILGVGSRLIPGILGHVEIVKDQRHLYENNHLFLKTVPLKFYGLILIFLISYLFDFPYSKWISLFCVSTVAIFYWRLYQFPKEKTALTWNIWISAHLIVYSFLLKAIWSSGAIHAGHSFFFSGIVLLTLLIATRVLVSHGPKIKALENKKILYLISFFVILAGATRVSAILMPEHYYRHLAYSSFTLVVGVLIWSYYYLKFVKYTADS